MSHRKLVRVHEEFVWKGRTYFEKLHPAEFVCGGHEFRHVSPAIEYGVARRRREQTVLKEAFNLISRQEREDVLISAHAVRDRQGGNSAFECFVSWERGDSRCKRAPDPIGQMCP